MAFILLISFKFNIKYVTFYHKLNGGLSKSQCKICMAFCLIKLNGNF
jgi:hypothetical protein